jgi:2-hydroxy-6-oxonona-2,4-dienedioate hydrolase
MAQGVRLTGHAAHLLMFITSKIPDAKLIIYDTGGRLMVGHQEAVRTAVRSFLAAAGSAAQ